MASADEITPDRVTELLNSDDPPRIIDIRSSSAYRAGHIPHSENIPFTRLLNEVERLAGDDHIVTVCPHGQASLQAVRLLRSYEGIDDARIESLAGGLEAWDGPLVTDPEEPRKSPT